MRFKKLYDGHSHIERVGKSNSFKLNSRFKDHAKKALAKGESIHRAITMPITTHADQAARKKLKAHALKEKKKAAKLAKAGKAKAKKAD